MKCPICGHNDWRRAVKKEPIGASLKKGKWLNMFAITTGMRKSQSKSRNNSWIQMGNKQR